MEKWRASAKHDFVRPDGRFGTDQRYVDKRLSLQEGVECGKDVTLMVVPSQGIM